MQVRCPNCRSSIRVDQDTQLNSVTCGACQSNFNLVSTEDMGEGVRQTIGHFQLIEQVGAGGFGVVWKAYDTELDRHVAVKIPRANQLDEADAERFLREARAVAQLRHPAIVPVHEVGRAGNTVYIVSDFIHGETLAEWSADRWLGLRKVAELCVQLTDALNHAHENGIIHRDLKPANVMLDRDGRPYIMDFGLAKRNAAEITMTLEGRIMGTPAYMSPEQARGESQAVTPATDIYSLGVVLFELLTGELPFRGNLRMLLLQILQEDPPLLRRFNSTIPRDLETICLKCLQKQPASRYDTAADLGRDLQRYLNGEPIAARPVGSFERAYRWCKRHPAAASLVMASAVAVAALAGFLVSRGYNRELQTAFARLDATRQRESQEKQRAQTAQQVAERLLVERTRQTYFSNIVLAERERTANNVVRARHLLDECPEELRGWEWQFLSQLCQQELYSYSHGQEVSALAYSPDGRRIASAGADRQVQIRSAATGELELTIENLELPVTGLAFSPDGERLLGGLGWIGADDLAVPGAVLIWQAATGEEQGRLPGVTSLVDQLTISPDGRYVALPTYASEGASKIIIWDLTGERIAAELTGHAGPVSTVNFSSDVKYLVSACRAKLDSPTTSQIKVWSVGSWEERLSIAAPNDFGGAEFSHDGKWIATGTSDGYVRVFDAVTGKQLWRLAGHQDQVWQATFVSHQRLASSSFDGTVKVWDLLSQELVLTLRGHFGIVLHCVASPDGRRIASGGLDGTVRVWDPQDEDGVFTLSGHPGIVHAVAFSPDGSQLASVDRSGFLKIWDAQTGLQLFGSGPEYSGRLSFSPLGRGVASLRNGAVSVFDPQAGRTIVTGQTRDTTGWMQSIVYRPDGKQLATLRGGSQVGEQGEVTIWDAATGEALMRFPCQARRINKAGDLAYSPDGQRLATVSGDNAAYVWDATGGDPLLILQGHTGALLAVAFSPDGGTIATGGDDCTVRLWDARTGNEIRTLYGHTREVRSLAFHPSGGRLVSSSNDSNVKIWDVDTGLEVITLRGARAGTSHVVFSPDGQRVACGCRDKTVRIWDVAPLTAELRMDRRAARLVNRLSSIPLVREDLVAAIRDDETISESVRQRALSFSTQYRENPQRLLQSAMHIVARPTADRKEYASALRLATAARQHAVLSNDLLSAIGGAFFRLDQLEEARQALETARSRNAVRRRYRPTNLALLAMTYQKLGEHDNAQETLVELQSVMRRIGLALDDTSRSLHSELLGILAAEANENDP